MKGKIITAALLLTVHLVSGFTYGQNIIKETRQVRDFNRVSFGVAGNLYINIGPEFRLVIEGDKRILSEIETEVNGGKLVIKNDDWHFNFGDSERVTVNLTMPEITGLGVSGSGVAEIMDRIESDELSLSVSGSGKLIGTGISADELKCSISGSGDIILRGEGSVDNGDISISGSGGYEGESTEIDHLKVGVSGSGSCDCKAGDSLEASISGSGNVTYSGRPRVNARVSGSGHVRSK